jgi:glycine/D-amino acid oxidase-like deaminating enzyme
MTQSKDHDVVIVGAGAIGTCAAMNLAEDHDVLVLDKGDMTDNASGQADAFISDWWFFLGRQYVPGAIEVMREFFDDLDGTKLFEYNHHPYVALIGEEGNRMKSEEEVERLVEYSENAEGINYYTAEELEERWPGVINLEGFEGGVVDEGAGSVDPMHYVEAMKHKAEQRGAEFRLHTEVSEIVSQNGAVEGVKLAEDGSTIQADNVIVAAGAYTQYLVSEYVDLPVRLFAIYSARLEPDFEVPDEMPIVADEIMLTGPTATGKFNVDTEFWLEGPDDNPDQIPEEKILDKALHIPSLLNDGDDLRIIDDEIYHCPDGITTTPDQVPVVDSLDTPSGLIVADGSRGGVSHAPVIAVALRSILTGADAPFSLDHFALDRFEEDTDEFDIPFVEG